MGFATGKSGVLIQSVRTLFACKSTSYFSRNVELVIGYYKLPSLYCGNMACSDLWRLVLHLEKALFGGRKAMRVICISIAFFLLLLSFDPGLYLFAVAEDADLVLQAPAEIQKSEMRRQAAAAAAAEAAMTASMPVSSTLEADEEEAEGVPPLGRATGAASSNSGCCGKSAATSQLVNTNSRGCCKNRLASTGGTHHPAEGNKSTCCGVMPMSFQVSTHTVILFKGWETIQVCIAMPELSVVS